MSFLKQGNAQCGAVQVMSRHGKQKWFCRICRIRRRQATGDWMVLKLLVSNEVNIALGSRVAVNAQPPLKWSLILSMADVSTIIIRLNIE